MLPSLLINYKWEIHLNTYLFRQELHSSVGMVNLKNGSENTLAAGKHHICKGALISSVAWAGGVVLQHNHFHRCFVCWSQPISNKCVWIGPYGSYCDCKIPFRNNLQKTLGEKRLITSRIWKLHGIPRATLEVEVEGRKREPGTQCFSWAHYGCI